MVPPAAVHVTLVFVRPVTLAVNCCVPPVKTVGVSGEIMTPVGAAAMVTFAVAERDGSWTLVAVTVKLPVAAPAVYEPFALIVPLVAVQFTVAFEAPVTVAEHC